MTLTGAVIVSTPQVGPAPDAWLAPDRTAIVQSCLMHPQDITDVFMFMFLCH